MDRIQGCDWHLRRADDFGEPGWRNGIGSVVALSLEGTVDILPIWIHHLNLRTRIMSCLPIDQNFIHRRNYHAFKY